MLFHYNAIDTEGNKVTADVSGTTLDNAVALLQKRGLTVVDITEKTASTGIAFGNFRFFKQKIHQKDVVIVSSFGCRKRKSHPSG